MRADLHLHTVYSDGLLIPDEVAKRAKEAGVEAICFTDHDTMAGSQEKISAAQKYGLKTLLGWEVSAYQKGCKIHVLGYGCQKNEAYRAFRQMQKDNSKLRFLDMIERANDYLSLNVTIGDVLAERLTENASLHTMHVVRAFARKLNLSDGETYLTYFVRGKPAYSALGRPTPEQAIEIIRKTGGISSLAHPGRIAMDREEREKLFCHLKDCGLDGIECYYTTHTPSETEYFIRYARANGLYITGGSDFHRVDDAHFIGKPTFVMDDNLLSALFPSGGGKN